jgi:hypothetical protein
MTDDLVLPTTGTHVPPLPRARMNADVEAAYDLSIQTWGIPSNLFRTMAHHPALAITEVPYANSIIFDAGVLTEIPNPDTGQGGTVRNNALLGPTGSGDRPLDGTGSRSATSIEALTP